MLSCVTQALRTAVHLSTNVLFIPLLASLCRIYTCTPGELWMGTTMACFGGAHFVLLAGVSTLLAAFISASLIGTLQDRSC